MNTNFSVKDNTATATNTDTPNVYYVGQIVNVASRTWPGINQLGGVGRVTGVGTNRVSVRYVLDNRHEKEIDIQYVEPNKDIDDYISKSNNNNSQSVASASKTKKTLRDRSMLLGRCHRCGSLRTDCGSCDFLFQSWEENNEIQQVEKSSSPNPRKQNRRVVKLTSVPTVNQTYSDDDTNDNDDNDSIDAIVEETQSRYRRFLRLRSKISKVMVESSPQSDSVHHRSKRTKKESEFRINELRKKKASQNDYLVNIENDTNIQTDLNQFSQSYSSRMQPFREMKRNHRTKHKDLITTSTSADIEQQTKQRRTKQKKSKPRNDEQLTDSSCMVTEQSPNHSFTACSNPGSPDFANESEECFVQTENDNDVNSDMDDCSEKTSSTQGQQQQSEEILLEDDFIQPEGNENELPYDICDKTRNLQFHELGPFLDETLDDLEKHHIQDAKIQVYTMEHRFRSITLPTSTFQEEVKSSYSLALQNFENDWYDVVC